MNRLIQSIGVMQGRLLPKYLGRYQAHPLGYWQKEFQLARSLRFDYIEFILDYNDAELNPLLRNEGLEEIMAVVEETEVKVRSVCADYFMESPLHSLDTSRSSKSKEVLTQLIKNCSKIGITDIVIPCVDQSSIQELTARDTFAEVLLTFQDFAEKHNMNLSLETNLAPQPFAELLDKFESKKITVNYDTGNSASLGYNPVDEFAAYGTRISDIHIKDRKFAGGSVVLGTGDARFNDFFEALGRIEYQGPFIMQAYRDEEGIEICRQQLEWLNKSF